MRERAVDFVSRKGITISILAIVLAGVSFRLLAYGDLRLSVATMDTESYMAAAQAPAFSWRAFTSERLFATNLLYKMAHAENCPVDALSIPAIGKESNRKVQACFTGIVLAQSLLSVLGWGILIWSFSSMLSNGLPKLVAAMVLAVFAFTPQLVDWDSILSSESLTFSLFALALGLGIRALVTSTGAHPNRRSSAGLVALTLGAMLFLTMWIFVRDSNVYTALALGLIVLPCAFLARSRRAFLVAIAATALCVSVVALTSASQSGRWKISLANAFDEYVLPYPTRIIEFQRFGMPSPGSPDYQDWFDQRAAPAYAVFLISHPGFVTTTLFDRLNALFADNNQPYFKTPGLSLRNTALGVGDIVHAKSSSVVLTDLILVAALGMAAAQVRGQGLVDRTGLAFWLLASAAATLVLTFFADPIGVERHVLFSLFLFRLLAWLALMMIIDVALDYRQSLGPA